MDVQGASTAASLPPAIPVGDRLLHVGVPGTGATAVPRIAAARRDRLARSGVRYPGADVDHRDAVAALIRRRRGWSGAGAYVPAARVGADLLAELAAAPRARGFISDESVADCSEPQARRLRDALGPRLHVVIVLSGVADLLGPAWCSYVAAGGTVAYEPWLAQVLASSSGRSVPRGMVRRLDQAGLLERWVRLLGPDRVTVAIADPRQPQWIDQAFEALLGLPLGGLAAGPADVADDHRELTLVEAEMIRRLNVLIAARPVSWTHYADLVRDGTLTAVRRDRRPVPGEADLSLPAWAAERAAGTAARDAAVVRGSGCAVVGEESALTRPVPVRDGAVPELTEVPVDLATVALAGMLTATGHPAATPVVSPETAARLASEARTAVARLRQGWGTWRPRVRASLSPLAGPPTEPSPVGAIPVAPGLAVDLSAPASPVERP